MSIALKSYGQLILMQALQHKHEVMREKGKAMEDKVAQRMEDHAASKTGWDKEVDEKVVLGTDLEKEICSYMFLTQKNS